jgi:hypothetical protein
MFKAGNEAGGDIREVTITNNFEEGPDNTTNIKSHIEKIEAARDEAMPGWWREWLNENLGAKY